ncbi:MAG TPA: phosphohistidine phosphatase SixA [Blastocatellia bacterium]|nr:phosphohistidine phosphatase SixA [Blastocatellia bacterium]
MDIYLIRHGTAHPLGLNNDFNDEKRTLTPEGRERVRDGAKGLRRLGVKLDMIFTSPLPRAEETAQIVGLVLGVDEKFILRTNALAPGGSFDELISEIKQQRSLESVALVGHEPFLGLLASRISCGESGRAIPLRRGGACRIDVGETIPSFRGRLAWLLTPKQMRLIGKV